MALTHVTEQAQLIDNNSDYWVSIAGNSIQDYEYQTENKILDRDILVPATINFSGASTSAAGTRGIIPASNPDGSFSTNDLSQAALSNKGVWEIPPIYRPYADLLWTNESPSSTFAAQTVTIKTNSYNYFLVGWNTKNTMTSRFHYDILLNGIGYILTLYMWTSGALNGTRTAKVTGTNAVFGACTYNAATNNIYIIPHYIYGIYTGE